MNNGHGLTCEFDHKLEAEAIDLAASWVNGNRSHVLSELTDYSRDHAITAYLAIAIYGRLAKEDRGVFAVMLHNRT